MKENLQKEKTGFTQIKNEVLNDKNLSWKAKGLFAHLYSKPENWDFSGERIAKQGKGGQKLVYTGLKELEDNGYLKRYKMADGRVVYYITYSKKPIPQNGEQAQKANSPKRQTAKTQKRVLGNISNKDSSNKDINSNKDSIAKKKKWNNQDEELVKLLQNTVIERYPHLEGKFNFEKDCEEMNKLHRLDHWTYEQIEAVAKWSQEDQFWRQNIRSISNLRKHFDKLVIKIKEQRSINQSTKQWII